MAKKITDIAEVVSIMDACEKKIKITIDRIDKYRSRVYNVLACSINREISPLWRIKNYKGEIIQVFADEIDSIEIVS